MDVFIEQLVKRERRPIDFVIVLLCLIAAFFIVVGIIAFPIIFILGVALMYVLYIVMTTVNMEYEYCFTNGALDIDKIIGMKRRKRIAELNARHIEIMASTKNSAFGKYFKNSAVKKIYACTSIKADDTYFVIYTGKKDNTEMLLFNPNDTIKDGFRRLNPQKVFLDN